MHLSLNAENTVLSDPRESGSKKNSTIILLLNRMGAKTVRLPRDCSEQGEIMLLLKYRHTEEYQVFLPEVRKSGEQREKTKLKPRDGSKKV
jgi:hypothetical protein